MCGGYRSVPEKEHAHNGLPLDGERTARTGCPNFGIDSELGVLYENAAHSRMTIRPIFS